MDRITTATKAVDLFGAGKHGFKDGNLGLGVEPTDFNADWCNQVQEELVRVIEGAGLVPDGATLNQVLLAIRALSGRNHGDCELIKSGADLLLRPRNGNKLIIAGDVQTVPDVGVPLAPTGTAASTLYYIYAYMAAGVMTLERSVTGHSTNATTGVEEKTGDATRTLVGMARSTGASAWADTAAQRFVASWFNRVPRAISTAFTGTRSTSSATPVELNTEIRAEFVVFSDQVAEVTFGGTVASSANGASSFAAVGFDGIVPAGLIVTHGASVYGSLTAVAKRNLSEGYHYATALGWAGATTANFGNGTNHNVIEGVIQ